MEYLGTNKAVNEMEPLVSVCVQTYRHVNFIRECLDGILMQQTNFPFEIIVGEDESDDGTREVCIEYAEKHPDRIRLFLRSRKNVIFINGRPTGRFNFVENLKIARGKYIALCEGDDYWTDPKKLQKQIDFLEYNTVYAGTFHETQSTFENGNHGRIFGKQIETDFSVEDSFARLAPFHTSSIVFKSKLISLLPEWFSNVFSADMALFSILAGSGPLKKIPGIMSVYRKHPGGMTSTKKATETYHQKRIELMEFLNEYHQFKYDAKAKDVMNYHKIEISQSSLNRFIVKFKEKMSKLHHSLLFYN